VVKQDLLFKELPLSEEYMTEEEQIEQLKRWLKQYSSTIIAGIILAVVIMTSWRMWENYHNKILYHASGVFDEMLALRAQNETHDASVQADKLIHHYKKTPYAQMASLMLARDAIANKNYSEAEKRLNWVMDHSKTAPVREIARLRLARVFIAEKKADEALSTLDHVDDDSFIGLVDEVRGDAYLLQNNKALAKESYQKAIKELPKEDVAQTPLLQIKLDNLAAGNDPVHTLGNNDS
jgi:predicted negative regulator of RcsB-dependent stress response